MNELDFENLLRDHDPEIVDITREARRLVESVAPQAVLQVETRWGGYLLFKNSSEGPSVCWLSPYTRHVSLGFNEGTQLPDPEKLLQGQGKLMRHVKLRAPRDLENPAVKELISAAWSRQPNGEETNAGLVRIRNFCLSFPGTSETVSHGHPTFKAGKKTFAVYGIMSPSVAFKADAAMHLELEGTVGIFPTPYMAHQGWLSIRIGPDTEWAEVERLVEHSYRQVAIKRLLSEFERA